MRGRSHGSYRVDPIYKAMLGSDCSNSTGMATRDIRAQTMTRKEKEKNKPMNHAVKTGNTLEIFGDAKQAKAE